MAFDVTFLSHSQPRDCGDYRHRTLWPAQALGDLTPTIAVQMTHPEVLTALAQARVLVVGMVVEPDLRIVLEYRKSQGLPTVYEISDDFKAFSKNTSMGMYYAQPEVQNFIMEMAQKCDAVQFSSPFLSEKYAALNERRVVFMNQAWEIPVLEPITHNERCKIGWTASAGHIVDASALGKLLAEAKRRDPGLFEEFTLGLMTSEQNAQAIANEGVDFERTPTGDFKAYMNFINTLDGGLAHLTEDDFSQGRSDGKYIEYASAGVPAICHRSGTFAHTIRHGENGLVYENASEFHAALSDMVRRPKLREQLRNQAHQDLVERRNHRVAAQHRYEFYGQLVSETSQGPLASFSSPFAEEGFHHMIHSVEGDLLATMEEHKAQPSGATLKNYHRLTTEVPGSWKVWELFLAIYTGFGLTDHEAYLRRTAQKTKEEALKRAFSRSL